MVATGSRSWNISTGWTTNRKRNEGRGQLRSLIAMPSLFVTNPIDFITSALKKNHHSAFENILDCWHVCQESLHVLHCSLISSIWNSRPWPEKPSSCQGRVSDVLSLQTRKQSRGGQVALSKLVLVYFLLVPSASLQVLAFTLPHCVSHTVCYSSLHSHPSSRSSGPQAQKSDLSPRTWADSFEDYSVREGRQVNPQVCIVFW